MPDYEVPEPILNSPYEEPSAHWLIEEDKVPEKRPGRREAGYWYRDPKAPAADTEHEARGVWQPLERVNLIRDGIKKWRAANYKGASRTTIDLLNYWQREGRQHRLFFAQLEAAETIIFLIEARADFRQGLSIPLDEPGEDGTGKATRRSGVTRSRWRPGPAKPRSWRCSPPGAFSTRSTTRVIRGSRTPCWSSVRTSRSATVSPNSTLSVATRASIARAIWCHPN